MIYHFAALSHWPADPDLPYAPPTLAVDGTVHGSPTEEAVLMIVERFHQDTDGVVLVVDETRLGVPVEWVTPPARSPLARLPGHRTARIRGPLDRDAVVRLLDVVRGEDGRGPSLVGRDGSPTG
ncbi:DUF952 domain-containing protein [Streptomyces sp. NBC_01498]|uniref:DUF952 domain-containing protein n=1 Tax=Streptomyces sp. NBC_01498 TaxID=2975870 RepID=UPI002E7BC1EE|nr:DUF952 domain-containing protein [Streptomyces sp. NBC_01498]WTL28470.1 DUF952 domain-containing protein [Streptomyces sp. NBC_01498]